MLVKPYEVIACDPGLTSGFAKGICYPGKSFKLQLGVQVPFHDLPEFFAEMVNKRRASLAYKTGFDRTVIVCETFKVLSMAVRTESLEGFGMAKLASAMIKGKFVRQNPDRRIFAFKRYPSIESRMVELKRGNLQHVGDAAAHAITYIKHAEKIVMVDFASLMTGTIFVGQEEFLDVTLDFI